MKGLLWLLLALLLATLLSGCSGDRPLVAGEDGEEAVTWDGVIENIEKVAQWATENAPKFERIQQAWKTFWDSMPAWTVNPDDIKKYRDDARSTEETP